MSGGQAYSVWELGRRVYVTLTGVRRTGPLQSSAQVTISDGRHHHALSNRGIEAMWAKAEDMVIHRILVNVWHADHPADPLVWQAAFPLQ
jgi:hypothetical protein